MPLTMQVHVLRTVVGIPQRCETAVSAQLCRRLQARHHAWQVGAAVESVQATVGVAWDGCNARRTASCDPRVGDMRALRAASMRFTLR